VCVMCAGRSQHSCGVPHMPWLCGINTVSTARSQSDHRAAPPVPPHVRKLINASVVTPRGARRGQQTPRSAFSVPGDCYPRAFGDPDAPERGAWLLGWGNSTWNHVVDGEIVYSMCGATTVGGRRWYEATFVCITAAASSPGGFAVADAADQGLLHDR